MLNKLRRLYRGLCWLMDTDCGMPWDMADLGDMRAKVEALEDTLDIAALEARLAALEQWIRSKELSERQQTQYAYDIEPHAEDEAQHLYATITDTDTKEVYEGRLPLTNAGQPDPKPASKPVICSPLTKMGLTATTDDQFYAMAEYVVQEAGDKPSIALVADALQAYAKGDR